jgi:tetratricopeptide (TPR) repeat protein
MTLSRMLIPTLSLLVSVAAAQTPVARPAPRARVALPAPPAPAVAPLPPDRDDQDRPTPKPTPAVAPLPALPDDQDRPTPKPAPAVAPLPPLLDDQDRPTPFAKTLPPDFDDRMADLQDRMFELKEKFQFDYDFDFDAQKLKDLSKDITTSVNKEMSLIAPKIAGDIAFQSLKAPFAFAPQRIRTMSEDRAYSAGQSALDAHRYTEALEDFNQAAAHGGSRADGAWYWKAYTLIKLGRRDEALAAIAELRKSYPNSHWLDDAKALEVDAGKPVTPESESDEDLKLIALNGLVQSDPDRAFPLLENLLRSAQSPSLKKKAVYVLAQSNSPKAQQLLEQVARGQGSNPDLQLAAIRYYGERRNQPARAQVLFDIYSGGNDVNVKRAILNAFESSRDKDHLLQVAKSEKNQDLRLYAIRLLGSIQGSQSDLWQLYQNEASLEGKQQILESIPSTGNLDKLVEVAKAEKEPRLRKFAIQNLSSPRAATTGDTLAGIYATESDPDVKRAIIDALYSQKNVKPLIQVARSEKDVQMKRRILDRLVNMKSPEASDYLMEILK